MRNNVNVVRVFTGSCDAWVKLRVTKYFMNINEDRQAGDLHALSEVSRKRFRFEGSFYGLVARTSY